MPQGKPFNQDQHAFICRNVMRYGLNSVANYLQIDKESLRRHCNRNLIPYRKGKNPVQMIHDDHEAKSWRRSKEGYSNPQYKQIYNL